MTKIKEVLEYLNELYPFDTKEPWDNCGLLVGGEDNIVEKIMLTLDVTKEVVEQAEDVGADLIVSHHPVIFHPIKALKAGTAVFNLACADIGVISVHTPLDGANGGVSEQLAKTIGLKKIAHSEFSPMIVTGEIPATDVKKFAKKLKSALGGSVQYSAFEREIKTVAVCSGAGGSLLMELPAGYADAYVTGEAAHHNFIDCEEQGTALFVCGHFETENIILDELEKVLSEKFPDIEIEKSQQKNPRLSI